MSSQVLSEYSLDNSCCQYNMNHDCQVQDINIDPTPHQLRVSQVRYIMKNSFLFILHCLQVSGEAQHSCLVQWETQDQQQHGDSLQVEERWQKQPEQLEEEVWHAVMCCHQTHHPGQHQPQLQHHHSQVRPHSWWPHHQIFNSLLLHMCRESRRIFVVAMRFKFNFNWS